MQVLAWIIVAVAFLIFLAMALAPLFRELHLRVSSIVENTEEDGVI